MHIYTPHQRVVHRGNGFFSDLFSGDMFKGSLKTIGNQLASAGKQALNSGFDKYKPAITDLTDMYLNKGRANKLQDLPGMLENAVRDKLGPQAAQFMKDKA